MKYKLIKLLTVCLVTGAVLSPELLVFGLVWKQHQKLVQTQNACSLSSTEIVQGKQEDTSYLNKASIREFDIHVDRLLPQQYQVFNILRWVLLLFPIFVGISIFLYDRYLVYRAAVFQQHVEMLEKLWQQSIEQ